MTVLQWHSFDHKCFAGDSLLSADCLVRYTIECLCIDSLFSLNWMICFPLHDAVCRLFLTLYSVLMLRCLAIVKNIFHPTLVCLTMCLGDLVDHDDHADDVDLDDFADEQQ